MVFDKKVLGEKVKTLRVASGMTQEELGKVLGISKQTLSGIETGYRSTTIDVLYHLAEFFDVSTDYLLGRADNPKCC